MDPPHSRARILVNGVTRASSSAWNGECGFVGGTNDTAGGLVQIGARDYGTFLNRFTTVDPVLGFRPGSWTRCWLITLRLAA